MSNTQSYEEVTVTSDGVAVIKRFEEEEFPVPAIAFDFESDRDEPVTVTLTDTVPAEIEVEDLGFHPEYGSDFWTIDEETITFERELEPGESYTTVYGIRATGSDDVSQFLTEPTIESVDPPLPEGESRDIEEIVPEADAVVKDAISGDSEIPGLEDDDDGDQVEKLELNDPNESGVEATPEDGSRDGDENAETEDNAGATVTDSGSLTAALANEIREQNVSGEDVKLLRRALDAAAENDGATQARIDQLQDDISDLRAYTGALETFLDENGTAQQLIEEFETDLESFDDRLSSFQSELDSVSQTVSDVESEVDSVTTDIAEMEASVEELEEQVTDGEVAERLDEVEETLADLEEWQDQIKQTFGG